MSARRCKCGLFIKNNQVLCRDCLSAYTEITTRRICQLHGIIYEKKGEGE
jgi:hypothetical protein